jgi:cryptochrome
MIVMDKNNLLSNYQHYFKAFCEAKTGYPFIDAGVRQLIKEGWVHHIIRNSLACFLTRGDLWISWEHGLQFFLKYLLDADWSVCAGNWMWISSSAFEDVLNCSSCIDPGIYGRRTDPWGDYVKRYIPELANYPVEYVYEPWTAPYDVQVKAGCVVGKDYPDRIVIHEVACVENAKQMNALKDRLMEELSEVQLK